MSLSCYECFLVEFSRYGGNFSKDFHFDVMIDLTVSTVSAATCLDQGLELAGNSLSVGTNVES